MLDYIFLHSTHAELIQRSEEILNFLIQREALNKRHVELIWSVIASGQHEDLVRATLVVIQNLASKLPADLMKEFYIKVSSISPATID